MTGGEGRAGQETARLVAAAQEWLRTSAPHLAPRADDGEPCSCPLCRAVAGLREADPDTVGRWVDVVVTGVSTTLAQAAAAASDLGAERGSGGAGDAADWSDDSAGDDDDGHAGAPQDEGSQEPRPAVRRIPLDDPTADFP